MLHVILLRTFLFFAVVFTGLVNARIHEIGLDGRLVMEEKVRGDPGSWLVPAHYSRRSARLANPRAASPIALNMATLRLSRLPLSAVYAGLRTYSTLPNSLPISPPSPVPLITREDLGEHLGILNENGWHFRRASRRFDKSGHTATWWELRHSARFPSFKAAMGYVNDVADLAKSERHHPTILIFDRVHVAISLDTHDTVERAASLGSAAASAPIARWPGVTLRDIRMALLINPLFERHRAIDRTPPIDASTPSYDDLISVRITD